jgi:hypothetical protein
LWPAGTILITGRKITKSELEACRDNPHYRFGSSPGLNMRPAGTILITGRKFTRPKLEACRDNPHHM